MFWHILSPKIVTKVFDFYEEFSDMWYILHCPGLPPLVNVVPTPGLWKGWERQRRFIGQWSCADMSVIIASLPLFIVITLQYVWGQLPRGQPLINLMFCYVDLKYQSPVYQQIMSFSNWKNCKFSKPCNSWKPNWLENIGCGYWHIVIHRGKETQLF